MSDCQIKSNAMHSCKRQTMPSLTIGRLFFFNLDLKVAFKLFYQAVFAVCGETEEQIYTAL